MTFSTSLLRETLPEAEARSLVLGATTEWQFCVWGPWEGGFWGLSLWETGDWLGPQQSLRRQGKVFP